MQINLLADLLQPNSKYKIHSFQLADVTLTILIFSWALLPLACPRLIFCFSGHYRRTPTLQTKQLTSCSSANLTSSFQLSDTSSFLSLNQILLVSIKPFQIIYIICQIWPICWDVRQPIKLTVFFPLHRCWLTWWVFIAFFFHFRFPAKSILSFSQFWHCTLNLLVFTFPANGLIVINKPVCLHHHYFCHSVILSLFLITDILFFLLTPSPYFNFHLTFFHIWWKDH